MVIAAAAAHIPSMAADLTDDDKAIIADLFRETIATDRFPMSPRIKSLRAILAKLAPPEPWEEISGE